MEAKDDALETTVATGTTTLAQWMRVPLMMYRRI
jgi:hypothetical protein